MSKRQRSDREVVTACDLADAIEEVQNLVPEFTIENILNKTRTISRILREIPQEVQHLYSLLKDTQWYIDAYRDVTRDAYNIYIDINCPAEEVAQNVQMLQAIGFRRRRYYSDEDYAKNPRHREFDESHCYMICTHPNAILVASQMMMLRDKHKNPMSMLSRNYTIGDDVASVSISYDIR